jgi:hypothetical protein
MSALVWTNILPYHYVMWYLPMVWKFPPEIWRLVTSFVLTSPGLGIIFDTYFLYTYGSKLEVGSPRFSEPGDFFIYIIFVCTIILVSQAVKFLRTVVFHLSFQHNKKPLIICPPSLFLAEAVPGTEEDYPCTSTDSVIRNQFRGLSRCRHGGNSPLRKFV